MDKTKKEKIGWMILAEKSLNKMWDNKKDDEIWSKLLCKSRKFVKIR